MKPMTKPATQPASFGREFPIGISKQKDRYYYGNDEWEVSNSSYQRRNTVDVQGIRHRYEHRTEITRIIEHIVSNQWCIVWGFPHQGRN